MKLGNWEYRWVDEVDNDPYWNGETHWLVRIPLEYARGNVHQGWVHKARADANIGLTPVVWQRSMEPTCRDIADAWAPGLEGKELTDALELEPGHEALEFLRQLNASRE